jgi:hypothetical protein
MKTLPTRFRFKAKHFLKWAGGKTQLLEQMVHHFPNGNRMVRGTQPYAPRLLFVMSPHSVNFDSFLIFKYFVNQSMLFIDTTTD